MRPRVQRAAAARTARVATALGVAVWCCASGASAVTLDWAGHTWQVTSGGMAGVCNGNPANVSVDASGYLHLRISKDGSTWSAAELFTSDRLAFGTYQWQVEGPIDTYDKNVVLGLFPYGPQANIGDDGTNEIDIEYSRWGEASGPNGDYTDYPASGTKIGELSYSFSLSGLTSTSRFVWSSTSITDFLFDGFEPLVSSDNPLKTWTYAPSAPTTNVPQAALPLGMNLWCFDAPPSDGNPVEIVIHSFEFVAEGAAGAGSEQGGAAGAENAGSSGTAGRAGAAGGGGRAAGFGGMGPKGGAGQSAGAPSAGASAHAGAPSSGGVSASGGASTSPNGGATASGGAPSNAGATASGGVPSNGGRSDSGATPHSSAGCHCSVAGGRGSRAPAGAALLTLAWLTRRVRRRRD